MNKRKKKTRQIRLAQEQRRKEKKDCTLNLNVQDQEHSEFNKQESSDSPLLLTVPQVCYMLSLSRSSFYRLDVPGRVMIGSHVRYHKPTIEAWIQERLSPSS